MNVIDIKKRRGKKTPKEPIELSVSVIYSNDGVNGLHEARRLLAKKMLEVTREQCGQQSILE